MTVSSANAGEQSGIIRIVVLPPGDMNADGRVDLTDVARLLGGDPNCMGGPETDFTDAACRPADFDGDGVIDLHDVAGFQRGFGTGIGNP